MAWNVSNNPAHGNGPSWIQKAEGQAKASEKNMLIENSQNTLKEPSNFQNRKNCRNNLF